VPEADHAVHPGRSGQDCQRNQRQADDLQHTDDLQKSAPPRQPMKISLCYSWVNVW
jgi:hypothetical protein